MSEPVTREEFQAEMSGVRALMIQRFDQTDKDNARIEGKVDNTNGRVTALEKEAVRIKTLWSAGVFVLAVGLDSVKHWVTGK